MKGLIIKDIYCLKKQITTYGFVIFGVVAVAIMFVLSERFGNLRMTVSGMEEAGFDIAAVVKITVMFFMLLPIVCAGQIGDLFNYDASASFYKTAASMPVSTKKRVLSKFLTTFIFIAVGLVVDIAMAAVISSVSDIITFSKCMGTLFSLGSCMMIFTSSVITLDYTGVKPEYSYFYPVGAASVLFFVIKFRDIKNALINDDFAAFSGFFHHLINNFESRPYLFIIVAAVVSVLCYCISVYIAETKRGVA